MKVEIEISINNINNRKSMILNLNKIILIKLFIILFIYITFIMKLELFLLISKFFNYRKNNFNLFKS